MRIPSVEPKAKPEPPPVILVRWDGARSTWLVKMPSSGWTRVPGPGAAAKGYSDAHLLAAVRRMYGHQATKGARIVVMENGHDARAQKGRTK